MRYTKDNLYPGFTFGPEGDTIFTIITIYEESVDMTASNINGKKDFMKYEKYPLVALNSLIVPEWEYYCKQQTYEIY